MEKNKEFIVKSFHSLLNECEILRKKPSLASSDKRGQFYLWRKKREKLEVIENDCHQVKLDHFDREDLKKIIEIISNELLKLISPRKRKYAKKLIADFSLPSQELTWEKLNSVSNFQSLALKSKNHCATCSRKITWRDFFSKYVDQTGNQFCSLNCYQEFHDIVCDNCQKKLLFDEPYYANPKEKEGIICFDCAGTKCSQCYKTILRSPEQIQKLLLPSSEDKKSEKVKTEAFNDFPLLCKACQAKRYQEK